MYKRQDVDKVQIQVNNGEAIENTLKRGKVSGWKVDQDGFEFWSEPFSRKFVEILEREYDTPEIRDKLWEAVYAAHLDEIGRAHV